MQWREQTRARYPDESGHVERDKVRLYYEVYGTHRRTVFLLPPWSIIHSRHWKMQIPYLARHCRVITFDGRVKVIDFGLAKRKSQVVHTAKGTVKGKVGYLSPEQIDGKPADRRADVFALATTLWELSLDRRRSERL